MKAKESVLFIMAFKNLRRHLVKSIITGTAVVIGVSLFIFMDAWLLGMNNDSKLNLLNYETGAARIYSKAYFEHKDEFPLYDGFNNYEEILIALGNHGYNASPHAAFIGSLISPEQELPFIFIGIDPEREKKIFKYHNFVEKGAFLSGGKYEIMLGVKGAKDLGVDIGDIVRLRTIIDKRDQDNTITHRHQLIDLIVSGIINSPNPKTNGKIGYLSLDVLQDYRGIALEGYISDISIRKKDAQEREFPGRTEEPDYIKAKIKNVLPDNLIIVDWKEDAVDYLSVSAGDTYSSYVMLGFLLFLAVIGIANTMLMAVLERTKEIGMIRALGMTNGQIMRLYIYEAAFIGIIGSLIGIIIGIVINIYMVKHGLDFTDLLSQMNMDDVGYRVVGIFKSSWNYLSILFSGIIATLVCGITAIPPIRRALKVTIAEAMRFT